MSHSSISRAYASSASSFCQIGGFPPELGHGGVTLMLDTPSASNRARHLGQRSVESATFSKDSAARPASARYRSTSAKISSSRPETLGDVMYPLPILAARRNAA